MAAFASRYDLATHLGLSFEDAQVRGEQFDAALEAATDQIRQVCGWSITQETVSDYPLTGQIVPGLFPQRVFLPTLRLTAVTLSGNGLEMSATNVTWDVSGVVTVFKAPASAWCWPVMSATFTHGYETAPTSLKQVCLELVAESVSNPQKLLTITRGPFTESYGATRMSVTEDARIRAFMLPGLA